MSRSALHSLALGPGPEFDRIREIARVLGAQGAGIGDDCGLVPEGEQFFALSTDVSVEGVHFRRDWISLEEVGWRATAGALSDLAAQGAEPIGLLCAVTLPRGDDGLLQELMAGVGAAARFAEATVIGGDLSSAPLWTLAITVIGRTRAPVTRGGAESGDRLFVTGTLGLPRAALEAWRRGAEPAPAARARFAHPEPRIAAGRWLARHGAHAMIDLSDGLGGDAGHIAAASDVALEIQLDALPIAPEVEEEAARAGVPVEQFAAESGEEYELLVAMPPRFDAVNAFTTECGLALTRIGVVQSGSGVRFCLGNREVQLQGFDHFR